MIFNSVLQVFFYISILCCRLQGWMQQSCKLIFPAVQPHFWIKLKFYTKMLNKTSFLNSSTSACRQIWWMPTNQTFLFINFKLKPKLAFVIDLQMYVYFSSAGSWVHILKWYLKQMMSTHWTDSLSSAQSPPRAQRRGKIIIICTIYTQDFSPSAGCQWRLQNLFQELTKLDSWWHSLIWPIMSLNPLTQTCLCKRNITVLGYFNTFIIYKCRL